MDHTNETQSGVILDADESIDVDQLADFTKGLLRKHLHVDVPERLIKHEMHVLIPFSLHATRANALHLLRSDLCKKLVGPALAMQVNRILLAEIADAPVALLSDAELALRVRQDLVDTLERNLDGNDEEPVRPLKFQKTSRAKEQILSNKTKQVLFAIRNNVVNKYLNDTVKDAHSLVGSLSTGDAGPDRTHQLDASSRLNELYCSEALRQHRIMLDGAVDRDTAERVAQAREEGSFVGVAFATDESPPKQPRFRGLRFQISLFYLGTFKPMSMWDSCEHPPINRTEVLADIINCPGKKGADVGKMLEMQLSRLGMNSFDVLAGTGDGGGENEGNQGVHAHFENLNPGYVRRRCLPHIAWRTCDVAIRASGLNYKTLAAYLTDATTWSRFKAIAVQPKAAGGLGLFKESSKPYKDLFNRAPEAIIDARPETDLKFLTFLGGKEDLFHRLATKDLESRRMGADTNEAVLNLANIRHRLRRRILQEVLERCLYLYYWNGKHRNVANSDTWDELLARSVAIIQDLEISERVMTRRSGTCECTTQ